MGWDVPVMAHIPLIHGADGAKLSKRHGALGVEAYRAMGYLPEALRNYLVRLGWSHGDDEIMSTERDDRAGSSSRTSTGAPARFDFEKLESAQRPLHAPDGRRGPARRRWSRTLPYLPNGATDRRAG